MRLTWSRNVHAYNRKSDVFFTRAEKSASVSPFFSARAKYTADPYVVLNGEHLFLMGINLKA